MDFVFTGCDNAAAEVCPIWPGQPMTAHRGMPDPGAVAGDEVARMMAFRLTFRVLFSGDLVYVDRLLGVRPGSHVQSWCDAFHAMEALNPRVVVPGHGQVCDLIKAKRYTGDYLEWLVEEVGGAQVTWQPIDEVVARLADLPQSNHLENYAELHRPNINRAYLDFERR